MFEWFVRIGGYKGIGFRVPATMCDLNKSDAESEKLAEGLKKQWYDAIDESKATTPPFKKGDEVIVEGNHIYTVKECYRDKTLDNEWFVRLEGRRVSAVECTLNESDTRSVSETPPFQKGDQVIDTHPPVGVVKSCFYGDNRWRILLEGEKVNRPADRFEKVSEGKGIDLQDMITNAHYGTMNSYRFCTYCNQNIVVYGHTDHCIIHTIPGTANRLLNLRKCAYVIPPHVQPDVKLMIQFFGETQENCPSIRPSTYGRVVIHIEDDDYRVEHIQEWI